MSQQDSRPEAKGARTGDCWPQLLRPLSSLMFTAESLRRKVFFHEKQMLKWVGVEKRKNLGSAILWQLLRAPLEDI